MHDNLIDSLLMHIPERSDGFTSEIRTQRDGGLHLDYCLELCLVSPVAAL